MTTTNIEFATQISFRMNTTKFCTWLLTTIALCGCSSDKSYSKIQTSVPGLVLRLDFINNDKNLAITSNREMSIFSIDKNTRTVINSERPNSPCFGTTKDEKLLLCSNSNPYILDINTGMILSKLEYYTYTTDCCFIGDEHVLFAGTQTVDLGIGGNALLATVKNGAFSDLTPLAGCPKGAAWSCSAAKIAGGFRVAIGYSGNCLVDIVDFSIRKNKEITEQHRCRVPIQSDHVAMSGDGTRLGILTHESIVIYSISETGDAGKHAVIHLPRKDSRASTTHNSILTSAGHTLAISRHGDIAACACNSGLFIAYVNSNKPSSHISLPTSCVAISTDDKYVAAGHMNKVKLYHVQE